MIIELIKPVDPEIRIIRHIRIMRRAVRILKFFTEPGNHYAAASPIVLTGIDNQFNTLVIFAIDTPQVNHIIKIGKHEPQAQYRCQSVTQ